MGSEPVSGQGPDPFNRVDMDLTKAISSVVVPCMLTQCCEEVL